MTGFCQSMAKNNNKSVLIDQSLAIDLGNGWRHTVVHPFICDFALISFSMTLTIIRANSHLDYWPKANYSYNLVDKEGGHHILDSDEKTTHLIIGFYCDLHLDQNSIK